MASASTPRPWRWADWEASFGTYEDPDRMIYLEHSPKHGSDPSPVLRERGDASQLVFRLEDSMDNDADRQFILDACNSHDKLLRYEEALRRIAQWDGDPRDENAVLDLRDIADATLGGLVVRAHKKDEA